MNLTPLQREIQQRSDNTLGFGCVIEAKKDTKRWKEGHLNRLSRLDKQDEPIDIAKDHNIIGHPMNRGRLCYLYTVRDDDDYELEWGDRNGYSTWYNLLNHSKAKPGMLLSTVLERDEETCMIVLSFLKTLGPL